MSDRTTSRLNLDISGLMWQHQMEGLWVLGTNERGFVRDRIASVQAIRYQWEWNVYSSHRGYCNTLNDAINEVESIVESSLAKQSNKIGETS